MASFDAIELSRCEKRLQRGHLPRHREAAANSETKDRSALLEAMDKLNQHFGRGTVCIGSATAARANDVGTATWVVRQDRRSPRYTTRWVEVPVVR